MAAVNLQRIENALTSKKWCWIYTDSESCPKSLFAALQLGLPHIDKSSWHIRCEIGGVYLNGLPAFQDQALKAPCKVEYYEPKFEHSDIREVFPPFDEKQIIYRDEWILVAWKPAGLSCMPTKEQKTLNLKTYLEEFLKLQIHMPSRLDTSTQGLVVVSLHPEMHNYLQKAFERKTIIKRYLLEVAGVTTWDALPVIAAIGRDTRHPVLRQVVSDGGKNGVTFFTTREKRENSTLLLARLMTGRTHQIRLHASHIGFPIIGDNFYGGLEADTLHLLSHEISLWHPHLRQRIEISTPDFFMPQWAVTVQRGN